MLTNIFRVLESLQKILEVKDGCKSLEDRCPPGVPRVSPRSSILWTPGRRLSFAVLLQVNLPVVSDVC